MLYGEKFRVGWFADWPRIRTTTVVLPEVPWRPSPTYWLVLTEKSEALPASVMLNASRNSEVRTEYATGVSFSAIVMRPPASELVATKPTSDVALTLNGSSLTVVSSVVPVGDVGAAWPKSDGRPNTANAT